MTDTLFNEELNEREFGTRVFHVGELSEWLKSKKLHLSSVPKISEFEFVQVEALLCAIERSAKHMTFKAAYDEVAKDPRLSSDPAAKSAPVWLLAAEAHLQWRKDFAEAVSAGELQLLDLHSKRPIAGAVHAEKADTQPMRAGSAVDAVRSVAGVVTHTTKTKRQNILDPVIELAKSECSDPSNTMQVYAQLEVLAQVEHLPLLASTPDGLKYTHRGADAYLTKDALDKRLHPEKRKPRR